MTTFKITSAITDGTTLSVSAKGCIQTGTRLDENEISIPIITCRTVSVSLLEKDLPEQKKLAYIKQKVEEAYDALPDLAVVKQLIGKQWTPVIKKP